jgi:sialate O-acetylesterase
VLQFSAVAYFFAKKIFDKYGIPVGLINASVGGTPIEAWTSEEGLKEFPSLLTTIQKNKDTAYVNGANRAARAWSSNLPRPQDKGLQGTPWYSTAYAPKNWRTITVPGYWEDQGIRNLDGIVWYRKEITVPASMSGKAARMALGRIVDADVVYVNGQQVGTTGYQYPQRRYSVPAGLLKAGENLVVVKVTNNSGKGGFVPDKPYYIAAAGDTLDLKGDWRYKVGAAFEPPTNFVTGVSEANQPTSLYNAMLAPATHHTIKGILWYQGESNIRNAAEYERLLPALIRDWRSKWQQGDLPFLFVQLPNYDDVQYLPTESPWAVLREGIRKTLSVPATGMAVTIDVGEWNDIHPDRKKEVGERLALAAMKVAYGKKPSCTAAPWSVRNA